MSGMHGPDAPDAGRSTLRKMGSSGILKSIDVHFRRTAQKRQDRFVFRSEHDAITLHGVKKGASGPEIASKDQLLVLFVPPGESKGATDVAEGRDTLAGQQYAQGLRQPGRSVSRFETRYAHEIRGVIDMGIECERKSLCRGQRMLQPPPFSETDAWGNNPLGVLVATMCKSLAELSDLPQFAWPANAEYCSHSITP